MNRRSLLAALAVLPLSAAEADEVWTLFTDLAAALSAANAQEFLEHFDRGMPGYAKLRANIEALVVQDEVHSSIDLLSDEGDSVARTVEVDWYLQLVGQENAGGVTQRRQRVHCRLIKLKKRWRIQALEPQSLFAPPELRR